jgi:hypothetical protein
VFVAEDDGRGVGSREDSLVFGVGEERDLPRSSRLDAGDAGDLDLTVALESATEMLCELA